MNNNKDKALIIVISLIAALLSWFYVVTERNPETTQGISDVEIEIRNENELNSGGLVVSNIDTTTVDVSIRGLRNEVININSTAFNAFVDSIFTSDIIVWTLLATTSKRTKPPVVSMNITSKG